ncbi:MAG: PEGA domain-containing protein [Myxococcota bacterium]
MARLAPLIGRLSIDSDPPGARVYVERRDLGERGTTPLVLALRPGRHEVIVERDGYLPVKFARELEAGDADSVAVPLAPADQPAEARWVRSTIQVGGEVIVLAEPTGCTWLPDRGPLALGNGAPPVDALPPLSQAPGSRLLADADVDFALDVTVSGEDGGVTTRSPLSLTRPGALSDPAEVRQWALATCTTDAASGDASATTGVLHGLPKPLRKATVAVLGELVPAPTSEAAKACAKGDCQRFVDALLAPGGG